MIRFTFCFLLAVAPFIARASDSADESSLIAVLQSQASPREKDAACSQLKRIGTKQSVPALAALLTDDQLSHSARYALESMQAPEAGAALLAALPKTSGLLKVGIINSLAVRHDTAAISHLGKLLSDPDNDIAVAAAEGLGRIGGAKSLRALESVSASSSGLVNDARIDAQLTIANEFLAHGDAGAARKAFQRIYDNAKNDTIRIAAYRGLILSSARKGIDLAADAIAGADAARQTAALQLASKLQGDTVTATLADLLSKTQPPVQIALLQCLSQRGDAAALPAVAALADAPDADVRLAAISALGELGDGSVTLLLAQKAATATGAEKTAARRALLDIRRGEVTAALIQGIAAASPKVQLELLRALGSRGDKSALPKLTELAKSDDDSLRAASCQALALLAGPPEISTLIQLVVDAKGDDARSEAAEALGVVYQRIQAQAGHVDASPLADAVHTAPLDARLSLLAVCGGLNEPAARDALRASVKDSDARVREAAITAMCDTRDADLLPDLVQLVRGTDEPKFRFLAVSGFVRLTTREENVKITQDAKVRAFRAILGERLDDGEKRLVLSGLATIPDPRALSLARPMLEDTVVRPEAARAVIQIAGALSNARSETATEALKQVLEVSSDPAVRDAAEAVLRHIEEMSSYITGWQVAGPYLQAGKDYAALFDIPFPPENAQDSSTAWQPLPAATDPAQPWKLDLLKALGGEQRVAYVRTWIYSPDERSVKLEMGTDDGVKAWLDGRLIHANNASRALDPGSDKVDAALHQGWNPLLLKITQNSAGWEFCVRLATPDGTPITNLRTSAVPPG